MALAEITVWACEECGYWSPHPRGRSTACPHELWPVRFVRAAEQPRVSRRPDPPYELYSQGLDGARGPDGVRSG